MWLLTCDGDLFAGKRLWLRPGTTHLLGRTSGRPDGTERIQYIDHKSVSRKHLLIAVSKVQPGDSAQLYARSKISVTDGSKMGSTINGDKLVQGTRVLEGKDFAIRLGNYQHGFRLVWNPVVVSLTTLGKKAKAAGDPLSTRRHDLEQADVKLVTEYVTNETTHVVAKKRNTPAGLQALLQARWLVTDDFIDALTRAVAQNEETASLLEQDFESHWPKEDEYLVPAGAEPQQRPAAMTKPNLDRAEVLHKYTFVFLSRTQYDLLLAPITAGSGKALLWEVEVGRSKPEELVQYLEKVAGHKQSGQLRLGQKSEKGGVVVVRLNGGEEGWKAFQRAVDIAIDQRSIEQNEFLDAIMCNDASPLKQQLKESDDSLDPSISERASLNPASSQAQTQLQTQQSVGLSQFGSRDPSVQPQPTEVEPPPPQSPSQRPDETPEPEPVTAAAKHRARRGITKSRFQGFDEIDPSQIRRAPSDSPEPSRHSLPARQSASVQDMDVDDRSREEHSHRESRKRSLSPEETEEQMYEKMLTSVAAMKRRKLETAKKGGKSPSAEGNTDAANVSAQRTMPARKKAKEIDVLAEVQRRREAEEELRRRDEEALREGLDGIDISELKDLAKVEPMDIVPRDQPLRRSGEHSGRHDWDPAWNGRKNFKKFRRQGDREDLPRLRPVFVALQEVPRKTHGMGDEYWLTPQSGRSKSKSQSQSQTQTLRPSLGHSEPPDEDEEDVQRFRRRLAHSRREDADNTVADDLLPEEIAGQARDESLPKVMGTGTQPTAAAKRPASSHPAGPATKKAKTSRPIAPSRESVAVDNDDDDGDELKFRRRKR